MPVVIGIFFRFERVLLADKSVKGNEALNGTVLQEWN